MRRKSIKNRVLIFTIIIILLIVILTAIYLCIFVDICSIENVCEIKDSIDIKDMLRDFIKSIIGGGITFISLYYTVFNQETQTVNQLRMNSLLQIRPCLSIVPCGAATIPRNTTIDNILSHFNNEKKYIYIISKEERKNDACIEYYKFAIKITNLGFGVARNIVFADENAFFYDLSPQEYIETEILVCNNKSDALNLYVCFDDIYGNKYTQLFKVTAEKCNVKVTSTEPEMKG